MIEVVRAGLALNSAFVTKLGTDQSGTLKVYFEEAPQSVKAPYVILSQIDSLANDSKVTKSTFDQSRVQVVFYSTVFNDAGGIAGARNLANLARTALDQVLITFESKANRCYFESRRTFNDELDNKNILAVEDTYEVYNEI